MRRTYTHRYTVSPFLDVAVEESGNVVLVTPERVITVTDVERLRSLLATGRILAAANAERAHS